MVYLRGSIVFITGIGLRRSRLRIAGGLSVSGGALTLRRGRIRGTWLTGPTGGGRRAGDESDALFVQLPLRMESCTKDGGSIFPVLVNPSLLKREGEGIGVSGDLGG